MVDLGQKKVESYSAFFYGDNLSITHKKDRQLAVFLKYIFVYITLPLHSDC